MCLDIITGNILSTYDNQIALLTHVADIINGVNDSGLANMAKETCQCLIEKSSSAGAIDYV